MSADEQAKKPKPQDLLRLSKYPNWYMVPTTGQLVFRKVIDGRSEKIRTGIVGKLNPKTGLVEGIVAARKFVDEELERRKSGKTDAQIERERKEITNPFLEDLWREMRDEKIVGKELGTVKNYDKSWKNGMRGFMGKPPTDPTQLKKDKEKNPRSIPAEPYKTLRDINDKFIRDYKAWYLEKNEKRLFEKTHDFLKMFLTWLHERGHIAKVPDLTPLDDIHTLIKKKKRYKKAGRVFKPAEEQALLNAWPQFLETQVGGTTMEHKTVLAARSRCATALGLRCGLRIDSEILQMKVESIDFANKVLKVWSKKNHEWRDVPMVPLVAEAIRYQLKANAHFNSEWLFPSPENPLKPVSYNVFQKTWYRTRDYAGLKVSGPYDARFHDCRKTFATRTAELGWPVKVACEILDMTPEVYLEIYVDAVSYEVKRDLMLKHFGGVNP